MAANNFSNAPNDFLKLALAAYTDKTQAETRLLELEIRKRELQIELIERRLAAED